MTDDVDQAIANQIADGCKETLEESAVIAAQVKGGPAKERRIIERGQISTLVQYVVEEKQEDARNICRNVRRT